tara:strand:+ start:152 stop:586 length:435 start_codon:yes stop_codon:yes gene_type:complete
MTELKDLKFGLYSENTVLNNLEKFFDCDLIKTSKYCSWDFENKTKDLIIELKTRRNTKNLYPTTMIGMNKINKFRKMIKDIPQTKIILAFKFTDGLYYFNLNETSITDIGLNLRGGRNDRTNDEYIDDGYAFIPVKLLQEVIYK